MSDGVTCIRCLGRIDAAIMDSKRRISTRLGKPYSPPKVCSECLFLALAKLVAEPDDEPVTPPVVGSSGTT